MPILDQTPRPPAGSSASSPAASASSTGQQGAALAPTDGEAIKINNVNKSAAPCGTPTLGEAAYYGKIGEFLRAVEPHTEATPAAILAHLLPALGTLIGPKPYIFAGSRQTARVFTVVVGRTNTGRKGTAFTPVDMLCEKAAPSFWPSQRVTGLSSGEGLIVKVQDKEQKPESEKGNEKRKGK